MIDWSDSQTSQSKGEEALRTGIKIFHPQVKLLLVKVVSEMAASKYLCYTMFIKVKYANFSFKMYSLHSKDLKYKNSSLVFVFMGSRTYTYFSHNHRIICIFKVLSVS